MSGRERITDAELIDMVNKWPKEVREKAMEQLRALKDGTMRAWYCKRGRSCDGEPHAGYPYPHARGDQWPPPGRDWRFWFLSGGRGSGKTRTGAEYTWRMSDRTSRIALVAPTGADARDTMVEGVSGLQFVAARNGQRIEYEPSKRRVTFPNGCIATTFSAEQPDRLRGPQHGFAWLDEPAHYPNVEEVWSNLIFGLRLGDRPHVVLTSTPLPTPWVKEIQKRDVTRVVRVSTFANRKNLAEEFFAEVVDQWDGTRLGKQELYGELLLDVPGALWRDTIIHREKVEWEDLDRIVVAIDPAGTANRRSDLTGIVVVGVQGRNAWVLNDSSGKYTPTQWARKVIELYKAYEADAVVAEKNYGGDMVAEVIRRAVRADEEEPRILVKQATRSKQIRAEPVVSLYEQTRVFHWGNLAELEDEMLTWVPGEGDSPNRVDALVWGISELMQPAREAHIFSARGRKMRPKSNRGYDPRDYRRSA